MDTTVSVLRFARRFLAGTALSRVSGAARDVTMAFCFGSAPEIAAFMVAYRLANLFRRLFGEGSLQAGFIPHFTSLDKDRAALFYRDFSFSLSLLLILSVGVIEGSLWGLSLLLDEGWTEILHLCMRMVPGLIFICLYALNSALLQAHKKFFVPAVSPIMFNLAWIIAALWARNLPIANAMRLLAVGISFAFALQWVMTATQVSKSIQMSWDTWLRPSLFSQSFRKMLRPLTFSVLGVGAMQVNSALDAIFSRFADPSGPAYLWYAIRIQQLPLALFGIALSGALLPSLSRAMSAGAIENYVTLLKGALRHAASLLIPCTFGLFALGRVGLNLLYGHGDFSPSDVTHTMYCLWGYGIGLVPSVFTLLLASAFYARKSYLLPVVASLSAIMFHVLLNTLMVFGLQWGSFSIAVSTSVAGLINCMFLFFFAGKYFKVSLFSDLWNFLAKLGVCSLVAFSLTLFFETFVFGERVLPRSLGEQCTQFIALGSLFSVSFFSLSHLMKLEEVFAFFKRAS